MANFDEKPKPKLGGLCAQLNANIMEQHIKTRTPRRKLLTNSNDNMRLAGLLILLLQLTSKPHGKENIHMSACGETFGRRCKIFMKAQVVKEVNMQ